MPASRLAQVAQAYPSIVSLRAELLAIGRFSPTSGAATKEELSLPFPVCSDESGSVVDRYSGSMTGSMVMARTGTYVIDTDGVVVFERVEDGTVPQVTMDEVVSVLERLAAGAE